MPAGACSLPTLQLIQSALPCNILGEASEDAAVAELTCRVPLQSYCGLWPVSIIRYCEAGVPLGTSLLPQIPETRWVVLAPWESAVLMPSCPIRVLPAPCRPLHL